MKNIMSETTRYEVERRFHLALSFVRWYECKGGKWQSREKPLNGREFVNLLAEQPAMCGRKMNLITRSFTMASRTVSQATHALVSGGLFPEKLGDFFGKAYDVNGEDVRLRRRRLDNDEIEKLLQEFPKALEDYEVWKRDPDAYTQYLISGATQAFSAAETGMGSVTRRPFLVAPIPALPSRENSPF